MIFYVLTIPYWLRTFITLWIIWPCDLTTNYYHISFINQLTENNILSEYNNAHCWEYGLLKLGQRLWHIVSDFNASHQLCAIDSHRYRGCTSRQALWGCLVDGYISYHIVFLWYLICIWIIHLLTILDYNLDDVYICDVESWSWWKHKFIDDSYTQKRYVLLL